jgi:hypothetical protein
MGNVFSTPFAGIKHFKGKIMVIYIHINFKRRAFIVYKQWLSLKFIIINPLRYSWNTAKFGVKLQTNNHPSRLVIDRRAMISVDFAIMWGLQNILILREEPLLSINNDYH